MSDIDPYKSPSNTESVNQSALTADFGAPQHRPAAAGWQWISCAFAMFMTRPLLWLAVCFVWFLVSLSLYMVPMGSIISSIISPVFAGGFIYMVHRADIANEYEMGNFFEGFKSRIGSLITIGVMYMLMSFGVYLIGFLVLLPFVDFDTLTNLFTMSQKFTDSITLDFFAKLAMPLLLSLGVIMMLLLPLMMAVWFAPAIAMLQNVSPVSACKLSFSACMSNIIPFTVYGLMVILLAVLASLPLFLGWLLLGPVLAIANYMAFKDIFLTSHSDANSF